jgi:CRISPR system Cascade subunit CasD
MVQLLLFQLQAPMASFGGVAVGERRETLDAPGHGALAGLLAAATGMRRDDPGQIRFCDALAFAVRTDAAGTPMADYHTTQAPKGRGPWTTRRMELSGDVGTILSRRDYRAGCAFTVAVMARRGGEAGAEPDASPSLESLASALRTPRFTLYLGRKSCPLGAPPWPCVIAAETLEEAFAAFDDTRPEPARETGGRGQALLADRAFAQAGLLRGNAPMRYLERRDMPTSRAGWRFDRRQVIASGASGAVAGDTA